jgi:hypoxanthine-DNA glycosylase
MPGKASIAVGAYYAHPANRFWPVMERLFGIGSSLPYPKRLDALNERGIGLWDALASCERPGSLDSSIARASEIPDDILSAIQYLPSLRAIAFNGRTARAAFERHSGKDPLRGSVFSRLVALDLPSTSPANASWTLDRLVDRWSELAPFLD